MVSTYLPGPGVIRVIHPGSPTKKFPISANSRSFPPGCPMWLNKVAVHYQAEPSLITTQQATVDVAATTVSADSGYATLALANIPFGPLFLGFAAEGRIPQQFQKPAAFSQAFPQISPYPMDVSRPFLSIYDRGVGIAPITKLATALEIGALLQVDGFANDGAGVGFYDAAGRLCSTAAAGYWLYMNRLILTTDATGAVGWVVERAPIGQDWVKFEFRTALNEYLLTIGT
jgi:hypothetical protein